MKILWRKISDETPPLIVGEVSSNHNQSLKKIYKIIDCASEIGLEAIKFQTFNLDDMTLNISKKNFFLKNKFSIKNWNNRSLYSIYKKSFLPFEWHKNIFDRAKKKGLICFSSVFDLKSLNLLESLNCPAYKIASLESLHFPLIRNVIVKKKPIIISTGTLNLKEIDELVLYLKSNKANFALLHCLTQYPANIRNCNLNMINFLKKKYKKIIGFSDHTNDFLAAYTAVSLGSNIIEKHFMLEEKKELLDSQFSFKPLQMEKLIKDCNNIWLSLRNNKKNLRSDLIYKKFRRSIYICNNILKGERLTSNNIKIIRPGYGLEPKYYDEIIGKRVKRNLKIGDPIRLNDLI